MFCKKCGTQILDDSSFCSSCGARVGDTMNINVGGQAQAPAKKSTVKTVLIVLAIVFFSFVVMGGILAAIAIPRFAKMLELSRQGATKGNLASIRAAITIYYAEKNGQWPSFKTLTSEEDFKLYLYPIPQEKITNCNKIVNKFDGTGGWYYVDDMSKEDAGSVYVNLKGTDTKGTEYSKY